MNIKNKIFAVLVVAIIATTALFYFQSSQLTGEQTVSAQKSFSGFAMNDKITVTILSKEKVEEKEIQNQEYSTALQINDNQAIALKIENSNYSYDVTASKNKDNLVFNFENLPLGSKVSLLYKNGSFIEVPVDWAGKITLKSDSVSKNICAITHIESSNPQICYEVTS